MTKITIDSNGNKLITFKDYVNALETPDGETIREQVISEKLFIVYKAVFRKNPEGTICVILPESNDDYYDDNLVTMYEEIGGHCSGYISSVIGQTVPALEHEYEHVLKYLKSIGYHFDIAKRCHQDYNETRRREFELNRKQRRLDIGV